jgi:hypothetical protein
MKRKRPNIPVIADWNDDSRFGGRIVGADELRVQKEKHEAKRPLYEGTEKLIAKYRSGKKVRPKDIARELAIAKLYHLTFHADSPNAAVPAELIDIVGQVLVGGKWNGLFDQTAKSKAAAARVRQEAQAEAEALISRKSDLSDRGVARILAKRLGRSARTIRRYISKQ